MKKIACCVIVCSFVIVSCNKETILEDTLLPHRLIKTVERTTSDSLMVEYFYDVQGRLIRTKQSGNLGGSNRYDEIWITRNSNGALTRTVEKAAYLSAGGTDSITTNFNYNTTTGKHVYSVMIEVNGGTTVYDSVAYDYDGSNRITRDNHFQFVTGIPTVQRFKQEYVYSGTGNIDSVKNYDFNPGPSTYSLTFYYTYQYDTNNNPLILNNDAQLLYYFNLFRNSNATQVKTVFIGSSSLNSIVDRVYNYRSDQYPLSAANTKTPGIPSTTTFYYQ